MVVVGWLLLPTRDGVRPWVMANSGYVAQIPMVFEDGLGCCNSMTKNSKWTINSSMWCLDVFDCERVICVIKALALMRLFLAC